MPARAIDYAAPESKWEAVQLCSASEALRLKPLDIVIEEDEAVLLSPRKERFARGFARVRLESFSDLQTLGFVPRTIPEGRFRAAITADDKATYKMATTREQAGTTATHECHCNGNAHAASGASSSMRQSRDTVRSTYNQLRVFNHPALARVLSDHYAADVAWDHPVAALAHKWVRKYDSNIFATTPVLVAVFNDITVNRGATLSLDRDMDSLYARDIWIHRRAQIAQQGSYMKIWAAGVRSFITIDAVTTTLNPHAPWRLDA